MNPEPAILLVAPTSSPWANLHQQLIALGPHITMLEDTARLLPLLRAQPPRLVLLASSLPLASTLPLLQQVRQDDTLRPTPIIAAAPTAQSSQLEPLLAAGADDYLLLPASLPLLQARLNIWLHRIPTSHEHQALLAYERDLQIGRQIQAGFLPPSLPEVPGWEIAARFQPAREVAGDFYDAFMLTQNRRLGFVLADVCDKGVGAALFMALVRSLIRAFAQQHHTMSWTNLLGDRLAEPSRRRASTQPQPLTIGANALKNAVVLTNSYMVENHRRARMYATLFFGVLDPATGSLIYVNGGHNPPILVGPDGIKAQLEPTGPVVGIFPGATFAIEHIQLAPGDLLLCYTDGVADAKNAAGVFFTEERLFALATQPTTSAHALLAHITTSLRDHIADAPQFDDITLLAVRRATHAE